MAADLDLLPLYDVLTRESQDHLSNVWRDAMATYHQTLIGYLTQYGIFIPPLTKAQRDAIQVPVEGQMIYLSDANTPVLPRTAELQIWQVVAGTGQWTTIV